MFEHIFGKEQSLLSLFIHGLLNIPMILGSVFLDVTVIRHDRTILRDKRVFP